MHVELPAIRTLELVFTVDRHTTRCMRARRLHLYRDDAATDVMATAKRTEPRVDPSRGVEANDVQEHEELPEHGCELLPSRWPFARYEELRPSAEHLRQGRTWLTR